MYGALPKVPGSLFAIIVTGLSVSYRRQDDNTSVSTVDAIFMFSVQTTVREIPSHPLSHGLSATSAPEGVAYLMQNPLKCSLIIKSCQEKHLCNSKFKF